MRTPNLPVDIGIFISQHVRPSCGHAVEDAARQFARQLDMALPGFNCRLRFSAIGEPESDRTALAKLERAAMTLEEQRLDFALFAISEPIRGPRGTPLLAASSQLLGCAVFNPELILQQIGHDSAALLERTLLRLFAALNGASEDELPPDRQPLLGSEFAERLTHSLTDVADQRLEESGPTHGLLQFYVRALWLNKRELLQALLRTRPWLFPIRLTRLMAGAVSASAVIMLTAEAWELARAQPWTTLIALALGSLTIAVVYLLRRQRLLPRLRQRPLTERRVTAEVASVIGVSFGMASTFGSLFVVTLAVGTLLYPEALVERWSGLPGSIDMYAKMAFWTGNLGMIVGALGASFEAPNSFRFPLVVDRQFEAESDSTTPTAHPTRSARPQESR